MAEMPDMPDMPERNDVTRATLSLLDPVPFARFEARDLTQVLAFAFESGDVGTVFEDLVDRMPIAASTFQPRDFARDIFLDEFVARCLPVSLAGETHRPSRKLLARILGSPPKDRAVVSFRHGILRELVASAPLRRAAEGLFARLLEVRALLARTAIGARADANRRRLGILKAVYEAIALAGTSFADATSGLSRVHAWGAAAMGSGAFRHLRDLLEYERNSAELDVRVQLGFDGRVRSFAIVGRRTPTENPFYASAIGRFFTKIALFFRGERLGEQELLARLIDEVFTGIEPLLLDLLPLIGDLEFYLGGLAFRDRAERAGLSVCLPTFDGPDGRVLEGLYNPLLLASDHATNEGRDGQRVVPCDLTTSRADALVVVTGPNSGGKTRLLQALALSQALAQAGLFVPAKRAVLPWAEAMFVSLIEQPSADQPEGRLGTELLRIRRLFETLRARSLVILDELCSGTNPEEGEEIFRLVVKLLRECHPSTFVTTHFLGFAARLAESERGIEFLQVELDPAMRPTFRFVPGVATTSLAQRTAARLGVTEEALRALLRANNPELASASRAPPSAVTPPERRSTPETAPS